VHLKNAEVTFILIIIAVFYLLAWAPYGIVSVWATVDWQTLPPYLLTLTGFFAKVSFTLNPLLYVGMNKKYRLVNSCKFALSTFTLADFLALFLLLSFVFLLVSTLLPLFYCNNFCYMSCEIGVWL